MNLALDSALHKQSLWFRYVDGTFVVWPHGSEQLQNVLGHLSSAYWLLTVNISSSLSLVTLMLEALCSSKTSILQEPHGNNPEDSIAHSHHRENLKSYKMNVECKEL
jgi:hypothetical protein